MAGARVRSVQEQCVGTEVCSNVLCKLLANVSLCEHRLAFGRNAHVLVEHLCHYVAGARACGEPRDPPPGPMWSTLPVTIIPIGLSGRVGPSWALLGLGLCAGLRQEEGKHGAVSAKVARIGCFTAAVHVSKHSSRHDRSQSRNTCI